jgi:predicted lipid-binding transport protein (Tim44 family)
MKTLSMLAAVLALGLTLAVGDAEAAKRLGGGKSSGMQRESVTAGRSGSPHAGAGHGARAAAKAQPGAAAPQAQPKRSWMGPLAGLAAGLGLAALASHFGFGEELASMLMIGLLVMAVMVVVGLIMRRRAAAAQAAAGSSGMQYAAAGADGASSRPVFLNRCCDPPALLIRLGCCGRLCGCDRHCWPASRPTFDVAGFVRNAKVSFIRLQAANDAGNLDDIREFTTPGDVRRNQDEPASRARRRVQETDVVSIEAHGARRGRGSGRYVVSVRFTGLVREEQGRHR